jgi:hypothetical protein
VLEAIRPYQVRESDSVTHSKRFPEHHLKAIARAVVAGVRHVEGSSAFCTIGISASGRTEQARELLTSSNSEPETGQMD